MATKQAKKTGVVVMTKHVKVEIDEHDGYTFVYVSNILHDGTSSVGMSIFEGDDHIRIAGDHIDVAPIY